MSTEQRIGAAIRAARKRYNLTQQQLGELVGLSDKTIRDIERGTGSASLRSVIACVEGLGLSVRVVDSIHIDTVQLYTRQQENQ